MIGRLSRRPPIRHAADENECRSENCDEQKERPEQVASDGFILLLVIQYPINPTNTLLVRSLCAQAMTLIVVTAEEE
jgi:hypothetical protein